MAGPDIILQGQIMWRILAFS